MNFMVNVSFAGNNYPLEFTEDSIMYHSDNCGTEVIGNLLTRVPVWFPDYRITFMEYCENYKITFVPNNEPVKLRCMKLFIKWEKEPVQ